jgi:hypothetical protein
MLGVAIILVIGTITILPPLVLDSVVRLAADAPSNVASMPS